MPKYNIISQNSQRRAAVPTHRRGGLRRGGDLPRGGNISRPPPYISRLQGVRSS